MSRFRLIVSRLLTFNIDGIVEATDALFEQTLKLILRF